MKLTVTHARPTYTLTLTYDEALVVAMALEEAVERHVKAVRRDEWRDMATDLRAALDGAP